ncbi:MAG: polysaccharide pyruvyl transferase family protein [Actinomycetota bacterium]
MGGVVPSDLRVGLGTPQSNEHMLEGIARRVRLTKQLRLAFPPRNRIAYQGWVGHSNMGDEAIFDVCRHAFPEHRLVSVPGGFSFDRAVRLSRSPIIRAGLLGGGTLIGRPGHRRPVERWLAAYPDLRAFALGVGALDPDFERRIDGFDVWDGLRAWRELLERFRIVTVRGPRSQEILAAAGIRSTVVGDPGLLVATGGEKHVVQERLLGINVGVSSRLSDIDWNEALAELGRFARIMIDHGWRLRLVPVWTGDVPHVHELARSIGRGVDVVEHWDQLPRLLEAISECEVFVGIKLHSVVFASAFGVPSLMLVYEPKGLDFQRSIDREPYSVALAGVQAHDIVDRVEDLANERERHSHALVASVGRRRSDLRRAIGEIRQTLMT